MSQSSGKGGYRTRETTESTEFDGILARLAENRT